MVHLSQWSAWSVLLVVAAAVFAFYFRAEAVVDTRAPAPVRWIARVVVGVLAWNLLRQLPVLIHAHL